MGGSTTQELATKYCRSKKVITNLLAYYAENDNVPDQGTRPRRSLGSQSRVSDMHRDVHLDAIFNEDPSLYIREARAELNKRSHQNYSTAAVIRAVEELGLTLKAVCCYHNISLSNALLFSA